MIKEKYVDPLQEAMEMKQYEEQYKNVAPSEYNLGLEMAFAHCAQTERAFNTLMESVGVAELNFYHKYGVTITEAADQADAGAVDEPTADGKPGKFAKASETFKNIGEKLIKILETVKEKIASIWKTVSEKIQGLSAANLAFYTKYNVQLKEHKDKDVTINGYTFDHLEDALNFNSAEEWLIQKNAKSADEADNFVNAATNKIVNGATRPGAATDADFIKNVNNFFYGTKKEITLKVGNCLEKIKNGKGILAKLNKDYREADASLNMMIKNVKNQMNKKEEENKTGKHLDFNMYKAFSKRMQTIVSLRSKAMVDSIRQAKAVCVKALADKKAFEKLDNINKSSQDKAASIAGKASDANKKADKDLAKLGNKTQNQATKAATKAQKATDKAMSKVAGPQKESASLRGLSIEDILSTSLG